MWKKQEATSIQWSGLFIWTKMTHYLVKQFSQNIHLTFFPTELIWLSYWIKRTRVDIVSIPFIEKVTKLNSWCEEVWLTITLNPNKWGVFWGYIHIYDLLVYHKKCHDFFHLNKCKKNILKMIYIKFYLLFYWWKSLFAV